jgi:SET domain-containing protein
MGGFNMLVVKTYLSLAGAKGIGLFAAESIQKGVIWWKDDASFNRVIPKAEADAYSELSKEFLETYATLKGDGGWYLCTDNARFVNHSDNPNTKPQNHIGPDGSGDWVASRDIAVGEEITSDYRLCCETCRNGLRFENKETPIKS